MKSKNRLLTTLSALGLAAGAATMPVPAQAQGYQSFGEFFDYVGAAYMGDLNAKIEFVRAYPQSPAAAKMLEAIVTELQAMAPAERQAAMDAIGQMGGIPSSVEGFADTPFASADVAAAFESMSTASSDATSADGETASIY